MAGFRVSIEKSPQSCPALPSQSATSTAAPTAGLLPGTSRHWPGIADVTGAGGSVKSWPAAESQAATSTAAPLTVLEPGSSRQSPDAGLTRFWP